MRWIKRDPIVKVSVIITVLMTVIVSMNLIELLDKYVNVSLALDSNVRYAHQEMKELYYTIPSPYESGNSADNEAVAKEKAEIKTFLNDFITNMPDLSGNVSIPLVYFKLNEGVDICSDVLLTYNEKLPYKIDYKNGERDGIYIGNSYNGYWSGTTVTLNGDPVKVAGVISSAYLSLDNSVVVPYQALNSLARERFLDSLTSEIFYDRKIPICFSSNLDNVTVQDIQLMEKYIADKGMFEMKNIGGDTEEEIESEKDNTPRIYSFIKQIVCIVSALFCFIAIFEIIRLFLNRKKKDITIHWALGSKRIVVYRMLIRELYLSIIIGAILAFICEWVIYGLIMKCDLATVFIYGVYAVVIVVLMAFIMMIGITNNLLKKCKICGEKE